MILAANGDLRSEASAAGVDAARKGASRRRSVHAVERRSGKPKIALPAVETIAVDVIDQHLGGCVQHETVQVNSATRCWLAASATVHRIPVLAIPTLRENALRIVIIDQDDLPAAECKRRHYAATCVSVGR